MQSSLWFQVYVMSFLLKTYAMLVAVELDDYWNDMNNYYIF